MHLHFYARGFKKHRCFLNAILHCAITTTHINKRALLGARANAAHIGRISGRAAPGLGLVITEDKEAVGAGLEFRTHQWLIGIRITPSADIVARADLHLVKGTNGLIA